MKASDVMVSPVITVKPSTPVKEVARMFLENRISAAPVVDDEGKIIGMVSEGDLIHRAEAGTERRPGWWLQLLATDEALAQDYVKAHARKVGEVMTRRAITATPDTPLHEIAALLEKHSIKRVPIVRDGVLVGVLSRANLIQAVATGRKELDISPSDSAIRAKLLAHLNQQPWAHTALLNVTVNDGVVDLWGLTGSEAERKAIRVAAEATSGVRAVNDNLVRRTLSASWS
jgi:CBS domain-containing protein